jgi:hypothetical protein
MTHKNMMEILQWARDNNVMRLKCEEIEVEFAPSAIEPSKEDEELQRLIASSLKPEKTNSTHELTEREELLYYSS